MPRSSLSILVLCGWNCYLMQRMILNVTYLNSTLLKPTKKGSCKLYRSRANAADNCAGSPNELAISLDTRTIYPRSVYKKKPCRDEREKGLKKTYWFPWLIRSIVLSWTLATWVVSRYTRIHERVQPGLQATESICLHVKRHWLPPFRLLTWKRGWGRSFLIHVTSRHWSNCGSYHLREYMRAMRYDVSLRVFDSQFHLRTKLTSERSSRTQGFEPLIIFRQLPKIAEDFRNFPRKCSRWFDNALIWLNFSWTRTSEPAYRLCYWDRTFLTGSCEIISTKTLNRVCVSEFK